ncbi:lytic transglycosylase domain-containing protein [Neorhizobium lilium]|uniref:Lytic transglycosylase domain-containing protein n=2 Tax=Neorhizobium lilium TaxID=2503024 RepID=A0A444LN86_9HYPH|nr:lytic transglycosylase domain-containing protein [Neorhizobium lilium]
MILAGTFAMGSVLAAEQQDEACLYQAPAEEGRPAVCIRAKSFHQDLCHALEQAALASEVPPDYLARLIWRESLFRPDAVSPKGAEGIAQFMPATARQRGLGNSFDVIAALFASSRYLKEMRDRFGNWGLAAAAYNAGEAGLSGYLAGRGLPLETRDYVFAITGYPVETWKERAPEQAAPPLDASKPFKEGCVQLAMTRRLDEPVLLGSADWAPWGVQLAAHRRPAVASRLFLSVLTRLPPPLNAERAILVRQKGGNFGYRPRYAARIGRANRAEATDLCRQIQAAGSACTVFRN